MVAASSRFGEFLLGMGWAILARAKKLTGLSEIMKHVLNFPPNTRVEFKSHDSSIQQRTALDEQRREKANQQHSEKRHATGGARLSAE